MLEQLMDINSVDDITTFGYDLIQGDGFTTLQSEFRKKQILFKMEDYWANDFVDRKVKRVASLQEVFRQVKQEDQESLRALHMLQIVQVYCPAASSTIRRLLKKCTVS